MYVSNLLSLSLSLRHTHKTYIDLVSKWITVYRIVIIEYLMTLGHFSPNEYLVRQYLLLFDKTQGQSLFILILLI